MCSGFKQLADAIDDAFARWDRSHLQDFTLADGRRLCDPDPDFEIEDEVTEDYRRVRLSRLQPGEQFAYVFDLGDDWAHLCTVGARRIDPLEVLGILPDTPLLYWGWGDVPDQYRRRWDEDDGESPPPGNPGLADLPPLRPHWGLDRGWPGRGFTALQLGIVDVECKPCRRTNAAIYRKPHGVVADWCSAADLEAEPVVSVEDRRPAELVLRSFSLSLQIEVNIESSAYAKVVGGKPRQEAAPAGGLSSPPDAVAIGDMCEPELGEVSAYLTGCGCGRRHRAGRRVAGRRQ